jgi:YebC/PmpR family DNA-binding regulatory protein
MSGHSHFKSIKHQKDIADAKRGKIFSKLNRLITIATKQGGGNPESNNKLKIAIDQAKLFNMPKENIERAIKKGAGGEEEGARLEEFVFEAFGPAGSAIIIEGITDNKNRSLGDVKQILSRNNGKLASEGSVKWLFEKRGIVILDLKMQNGDMGNKERLELEAIEAGADDVQWQENILDVYAKPEHFEGIKKGLDQKGIKIESSSLDWSAKEEIETDEKQKESCKKLLEDLDENDDVQNVYTNAKL